jgi:hypothetical protein
MKSPVPWDYSQPPNLQACRLRLVDAMGIAADRLLGNQPASRVMRHPLAAADVVGGKPRSELRRRPRSSHRRGDARTADVVGVIPIEASARICRPSGHMRAAPDSCLPD